MLHYRLQIVLHTNLTKNFAIHTNKAMSRRRRGPTDPEVTHSHSHSTRSTCLSTTDARLDVEDEERAVKEQKRKHGRRAQPAEQTNAAADTTLALAVEATSEDVECECSDAVSMGTATSILHDLALAARAISPLHDDDVECERSDAVLMTTVTSTMHPTECNHRIAKCYNQLMDCVAAKELAREAKAKKRRNDTKMRVQRHREQKAQHDLQGMLRDAGVHFTTIPPETLDVAATAEKLHTIPLKDRKALFQNLTVLGKDGSTRRQQTFSWQRFHAPVNDKAVCLDVEQLCRTLMTSRPNNGMVLDTVTAIYSYPADYGKSKQVPMEQACHSDTGSVEKHLHNSHQPISLLLALTHESTIAVWPFSWKLSVLEDGGAVTLTESVRHADRSS